MKIRLKKINEQVIVITGASSGIGLVTARRAASRGAAVVLAARNEADLESAVSQIRASGGRAEYVVADVAEESQVRQIAERALAAFGRIDTWVNNAGVSIYGKLIDMSLEDMRRQVDVNFWGAVHGCRVAVPLLRENGGALINVGSIVSNRAVPLQGAYNAAKQALKAYTDTLRMELEADEVPISVSLVKPASIDTPFFHKAKSLMNVEPRPMPPVYAPELVADTILECAERPVRDIIVGGMGKVISVAERFAPRLADRYLEKSGISQQKSSRPVTRDRSDNLHHHTGNDGGERGGWSGWVMKRSLYTRAALNPGGALLVVAGVSLALIAMLVGANADEL